MGVGEGIYNTKLEIKKLFFENREKKLMFN